MKGSKAERNGTGRLFAVLWILTAALAMHFVASAQGLSARLSAQHGTGNFSIPESGSTDTALTRHAVRAVPVAELRFTAERTDGKAVPGGSGDALMPSPAFLAAPRYGMSNTAFSRALVAHGQAGVVRVRGPPTISV